MQVKDVMTRGVECVTPHNTIAEAAHKMRKMDIGSLPICGDDDRLAGMITDRDITVRATADGCEPTATHVAEVMTRGIVYCFDDQDIEEAANLMEEKQIRRLAVLDRNKRLVGIVSLGDLAVKSQNDQLSGEALERVSEPAMPVRY
jgi:CBS domain-containing protein